MSFTTKASPVHAGSSSEDRFPMTMNWLKWSQVKFALSCRQVYLCSTLPAGSHVENRGRDVRVFYMGSCFVNGVESFPCSICYCNSLVHTRLYAQTFTVSAYSDTVSRDVLWNEHWLVDCLCELIVHACDFNRGIAVSNRDVFEECRWKDDF